MQEKIDDIRISLKNGTYLSALALALTLPDICSQVETRSSKGTATLYKKWVNSHLLPGYFDEQIPGFDQAKFTGNVCYSLRCNYLHSGSFIVKSKPHHVSIEKFTFLKHGSITSKTIPLNGVPKRFGYRYETIFNPDNTQTIEVEIDIEYLCESLCQAAETFYSSYPDKSRFIDHVCTIQ